MTLPISLIMLFCVSVVGGKSVIPFEMVLRVWFQGNCEHQEMPLVEVLPPAVSADRAMALGGPAHVQGSRSQVDQLSIMKMNHRLS